MTKIVATREADVPDGPVCVNWAYRTDMPAEQNFRCEMFRDVSFTVSDRDMGGWGSGSSRISAYHCALFDTGLSYEYGVGPKKCAQCLAGASATTPTPKTP